MSTAHLPALADQLWEGLATGAVERAGGMGTETTARLLATLLAKIRAFRRAKDQAEEPADRDDLLRSLIEYSVDAEGRRLIQQLNAEQAVSNVFHGPVTVHGGTIGLSNGPEQR
jgi:hypothetical protein